MASIHILISINQKVIILLLKYHGDFQVFYFFSGPFKKAKKSVAMHRIKLIFCSMCLAFTSVTLFGKLLFFPVVSSRGLIQHDQEYPNKQLTPQVAVPTAAPVVIKGEDLKEDMAEVVAAVTTVETMV